MDRKARHAHARTHINPKLRRNLRLFLLISVVLLIAVIAETISYGAVPWQVGLGLLVGVGLGTLFARMNKLSWDKDAQHVTSNIDTYGVMVLVLYIAFELSRDMIVHFFTHSESVAAISLALLAGTMYGRVIGSGHVIVKILKEQRVFSHLPRHKTDPANE